MLENILVVVIITPGCLCIWLMICNQRTFNQRSKIIDDIKDMEDLDAFNKVSYHKHLWYVMTFRNPHKLYGHFSE